MTLSFHPYANLFPLIDGQEFYDLAEDIRVNGLRDPIDLVQVGDEYQILDGRNRYRALVWLASTGEVLGSVDAWGGWHGEPLPLEKVANPRDRGLYSVYGGPADGEALAYVLSKNLSRRHLTESQRAMVAADLATLGRGGDRSKAPIGALTDRQAATTLKVSERSVERAKGVKRAAVPEVVDAVKSGDLSVAAAAEIASQPIERQSEIAKALTRDASGKLTDEAKKALAPLVREIRADKIAAKRDRRAEREAETGRRIQELPGNFYGVAIEDFEWHHAAWSTETGTEKHPSAHYETAEDAQTPEAIVARCAERFACLAEDCILFKWVTVPHLAIGIKVLELQGFRYVTSLVWNKERAGDARGTGYWFTGEHEIILVGVRGKVVAPFPAHFRSNFSAPVAGHSEKPDNLHEIIEFHWPTTPKVEFNARRRRDGWAAWGFDAPDVSTEGDIGTATDLAPSPLTTPSGESTLREAFNAARHRREVERLWDHPAVGGLHVVSMTRDYPGGVSFNVATCQCGWSFRCETRPFDLDRGDAVDAHWREVIAQNSQLPEPSGETEAAAADATSDGASAAAAVSDHAPYDAEDVVAIDQLAGSDWLNASAEPAPFDPASIDECKALAILSDFCHRRRELAPALGEFYHARGYSYQGAVEWSLTGKGWDRLRDLQAAAAAPAAPVVLTKPYRAPQPSLFAERSEATSRLSRQLDDAPPAEVVDGALQTRLPVDGDELAEQLALLSIDAAEPVDPEMLRHLVGKGLAHCGTKKITVTDDGRAFLAQLVSPAVASSPSSGRVSSRDQFQLGRD